MNLAKRLRAVMKTVSSDLPQQLWSFVSATNSWQASGGNKIFTASYPSAPLSAWFWGWGDTARKAADGAFYFEIKVSEMNAGNSNSPRYGIAQNENGTNQFMIMPRGAKAVATGTGTYQPYFETTSGSSSIYLWSQGDVMGCSIRKVGSNTEIRFYHNGVDKGVAFTISDSGLTEFKPYFGGYLADSARRVVLINEDLRYLPVGFEPW